MIMSWSSPTMMTSAARLAVSGMARPRLVTASSSAARASTRAPSGLDLLLHDRFSVRSDGPGPARRMWFAPARPRRRSRRRSCGRSNRTMTGTPIWPVRRTRPRGPGRRRPPGRSPGARAGRPRPVAPRARRAGEDQDAVCAVRRTRPGRRNGTHEESSARAVRAAPDQARVVRLAAPLRRVSGRCIACPAGHPRAPGQRGRRRQTR